MPKFHLTPSPVVRASLERRALGGKVVRIGYYEGREVYTCDFEQEMSIGLPEYYLWDGRRVEVVNGANEETLWKISSSLDR